MITVTEVHTCNGVYHRVNNSNLDVFEYWVKDYPTFEDFINSADVFTNSYTSADGDVYPDEVVNTRQIAEVIDNKW